MARAWTWLLLVGALGAAGCEAWDFEGDDGKIGFTSNLRRPHRKWTPETPVAVGESAFITAVAARGLDGTMVVSPLDAGPSVSDGGAFAVTDVLTDQVGLRAVAPGSQRVDFASASSADHFTVSARPVASARASDPVLALLPADGGAWLQGGPWQDLGDAWALAENGTLRTDVLVRASDGTALGAGVGFVEWVGVDAGIHLSVQENYDALHATAVPGASTTYQLLAGRDAGVGSVRVRVAAASEATAIELAVLSRSENQDFGLKATARLPDGGALWVPPFNWEYPEGFTGPGLDGGPSYPFLGGRDDVRLLTWSKEGAPGTYDKTVTVRLGSLSASATVQVVTPEPPAQPQPACGCRTTGPAADVDGPLALLALGAWLVRRPRRA